MGKKERAFFLNGSQKAKIMRVIRIRKRGGGDVVIFSLNRCIQLAMNCYGVGKLASLKWRPQIEIVRKKTNMVGTGSEKKTLRGGN